MKRGIIIIAAAGALLVSTAAIAQEYVEGEVIVRLKPGRASSSAVSALALSSVKRLDRAGTELMSIGTGASVEAAVAQLSGDPAVAVASPNYIVHASVLPNDPDYGTLWGMDRIDAPTAWDSETGSGSVVVGVIDTGVNYTHPDLAANMWVNPGEIAGNGIDDDLNGYVDDVHGINCINGSGDPMDDHGHGSHCSGTIGAVGDNATGVVGVNWTVSIMGLKFLSASGSGTTANAIECLDYAVAMGADLTSNSWGGGGASSAMESAIQDAAAAGQLFVAAAGNESNNTDKKHNYPSDYVVENVVSVAATDSGDDLAYFTNYGAATVDLAAPGVGINSTWLGTGYSSISGTSMATPHVAGAAALLLAAEPGLSAMDLRNRLLTNVEVISSMDGNGSTGGILNVANALADTPDPSYDADGPGRRRRRQSPRQLPLRLQPRAGRLGFGWRW